MKHCKKPTLKRQLIKDAIACSAISNLIGRFFIMKKLAPDIVRKRLLIEGFFSSEVSKNTIINYFKTITQKLCLRMYGEPIIFSPEGMGSEANQGYDAFVPLIDSGISLYVWSTKQFLSCIIYTCKDFDSDLAVIATKEFFNMKETDTFLF